MNTASYTPLSPLLRSLGHALLDCTWHRLVVDAGPTALLLICSLRRLRHRLICISVSISVSDSICFAVSASTV